MKIVKKESYVGKYGFTSEGLITPYWIDNGNGPQFFCNLVIWITRPTEHHVQAQRSAMAKRLASLRRSKGKMVNFGSRFDDPFMFLKWMAHHDKFIFTPGTGWHKCEDPNQCYWDVHGNVVQYSSAFHYRIYDEAVMEQIAKIIPENVPHPDRN